MEPSTRPTLPTVQLLSVDAVKVTSTRLRGSIDVEGLRESIAAGGLLQPIVVDASHTLVCGLHRLEACRALGWLEIPAIVRESTTDEARLAELDENLCRRELSALERAEHIYLRRRLWEQLRAERAPAADALGADGKKAKKKSEKSEKRAADEALTAFVDDTSKRTGRAKAVVREEIRIGALPEEVRAIVRDTPAVAHSRKELLALTRMEQDEQRAALERVRSGESKSVRAKKVVEEDIDEDDHPSGEYAVSESEEPAAAEEPAEEPAVASAEERASEDNDLREHALRDALADAKRALEIALRLWPEEGAGDERNGADVLREALRSVRELGDAVRLRAA